MTTVTVTTAQAEDRLVEHIAIAGAELILNNSSLSGLVGREVSVRRLRYKPGTSLVASWSAGPRAEDCGWAALFADNVKVTKALARAERVGATAWAPAPSLGMVIGDLWSDTPMTYDLKRIRKRAKDLQILRHNPRRRVVASAELDGEHYCIRVAAEANHLASSSLAWQEYGAPVLPVLPLQATHFGSISPWWGRGDLASIAQPWAAEAAGAALAKLHRSSVRPKLSVRPPKVADTIAPLAQLAPWWADRLEALSVSLSQRLQRVADEDVVTVHGDFSPDQVLLGDDGTGADDIRIIDLDRSGEGVASSDIGHFLASVARDGGAEIGPAFVAGYQSIAGFDVESVTGWQALSLLAEALEPFRTRNPHWVDEIDRIIGLAEAL